MQLTVPAALALVLALAAMSACDGRPSPATCEGAMVQTKKVSAPTTADSAAGMTYEMSKLNEFIRVKSAAATLRACRTDAWDGEVLRCITKAKEAAGVSACVAKLTPDQTRKLTEAVGKATADDMAALVKAQMAEARKTTVGHPGAPAEEPTPP